MKATGVVRRIDDLGRIVIPKELRRTMRIKEGDSLEIFIDGSDKVILRKYSPVQNIHDIVEEFVSGIYESNKVDIIITDSDKDVVKRYEKYMKIRFKDGKCLEKNVDLR